MSFNLKSLLVDNGRWIIPSNFVSPSPSPIQSPQPTNTAYLQGTLKDDDPTAKFASSWNLHNHL